MLVLTRKENERLILSIDGKTVSLTVCGVEGRKVRIGVQAPPEIAILRSELAGEHKKSAPRSARPAP